MADNEAVKSKQDDNIGEPVSKNKKYRKAKR